jgi:hypothetical protein
MGRLMHTLLCAIALIGQGNSGWASQPEREVVAASPSSSRDVLEFARRPLPFKYRWVADPEPSVETEPPTTSDPPGSRVHADAQGRTFYSLIDASGYTHWSYDWPRLWREVEAVNQQYATANDRRLAAMREEEERWRRANQQQQQQQQQATQQATWAAQRQAATVQIQTRPMYYIRPLAAALPTLGGSGAICST